MKYSKQLILFLLFYCGLSIDAMVSPGKRLLKAIEEGRINTVKNLLNQGIKIGKYPLLNFSLFCTEPKIAELLINRGSNVNQEGKNGNRPLHYAARCGYTKIVRLLVQKGAQTNKKNKLNEIPLSFAIKKKNPEIVGFLLLQTPDPGLVTNLSKSGDNFIKNIIKEYLKFYNADTKTIHKNFIRMLFKLAVKKSMTELTLYMLQTYTSINKK